MTSTLDPTDPRPVTAPTRQVTGMRGRARTRLVVLFVVYLVLLAWIVLWKLEVPWVGEASERIVKLVPFVATAGAGASTPFEVVTNVVLFVPFGLYLGVLAPSWTWWKVVGAAAGVSVGLEVTQYVLGVGSSDLTDVVVNVVGALAGYGLLAVARRRLRSRTAAAMVRVCSIGTVVALLASAVVVASPLRFAAPEDVRCESMHAVPCLPPGRPGDDRSRSGGLRVP